MNMLHIFSIALSAGVCMSAAAQERLKDVEHGIVCSLPEERLGYFGWPTIAKQAAGTLCVAASGLRYGHLCPWGRTVLCRSRDGGKTWSYPLVVNNTPMDDRDAGLVSLGGQRLAVTWFTHHTYLLFDKQLEGQRNDDGSWKNKEIGRVLDAWTAEMVARESGSFVRVSEDGDYWGEPRRSPVSAPHGFIVLKDGSWLYFGKRWIYHGEGMDIDNRGDAPICAARSTDEGRNWEILGAVPLPEGLINNHCHEPHVVELSQPNELMGAVRVHNPYTVMLTRSHDGGRTWSTLESVGCVGSPPHLLRHSSGAIVCVYGYRSEGFGQRCMVSFDEGKTWRTNLIIRDDGLDGDLGYPASVELDDGSIMTVYYQRLPGQSKASILWSRWRLPEP